MHFEPYKHQVAGHCCMVKLGGRLCKPLISRECDFYHLLRKDFPQLIPFTAEFYGSIAVNVKKKNGKEGGGSSEVVSVKKKNGKEVSPDVVSCPEYIVLQDLTAGMMKPCVMDIKMGTRQRFTTSTSLGFRLCGMRVWRGDGVYAVDRLFGRGLTPSSVGTAIEAFLFDGYTTRTELIPSILSALQRLLDVMEECPCRLYTSSLLFIYEGNSTGEENTHPSVDIRIVDFAHGVPKNTNEGELDDGFVFGLKNLMILFQSISRKHTYQEKDKLSSISFMEKLSPANASRCAPFLENSNAPKVVS